MTDESGGRSVTARDAGITAGGDVNLHAHGDIAGRDLIKIIWPGRGGDFDDDQRDRQQRQRLLARTCHDYSQRLRQALEAVPELDIGLELRPAAVYQQLDEALPRDLTPRPLPGGTSLLDVFRDSGGWDGRGLLVLGGPGSGKTISLVRLALALAEEEARDEADERPVPMYVPLSNWRGQGSGVDVWLSGQIHELYQLPQETALRWMRSERLLPILDGLDEISEASTRIACIHWINEYLGDHALPIVVSSRRHEYESIVAAGHPRIACGNAVLVKPLEPTEVLAYLDTVSAHDGGVVSAVADDPELLDLCRSPLLLKVLSLTYVPGSSSVPTTAQLTPGARRARIFEDYIGRCLRSPADAEEGSDRSRTWLTILARGMTERASPVFFLERLQYDWLPDRVARLTARIIPAVLVGLVVYACNYTFPSTAYRIVMPVLCALLAFSGLSTRIELAERLAWSWRAMRKGLVLSLLVAAVLTPLLALAVALSTELPRRDLVLVALIFFIYAFINGLLLDGFQTALAPEQREPNDGLKASIWNAIRVGVVSFFAFGPIILGCLVALSSRDGIVESVRAVGPAAALLSLVLALLMSLWKGLLAVIQHVILRILLWRSGCAPLHYTAWLEQMTKRRLLYRVGGGYVFMHAMLQAHLAGGAGGQDRVGR